MRSPRSPPSRTGMPAMIQRDGSGRTSPHAVCFLAKAHSGSVSHQTILDRFWYNSSTSFFQTMQATWVYQGDVTILRTALTIISGNSTRDRKFACCRLPYLQKCSAVAPALCLDFLSAVSDVQSASILLVSRSVRLGCSGSLFPGLVQPQNLL